LRRPYVLLPLAEQLAPTSTARPTPLSPRPMLSLLLLLSLLPLLTSLCPLAPLAPVWAVGRAAIETRQRVFPDSTPPWPLEWEDNDIWLMGSATEKPLKRPKSTTNFPKLPNKPVLITATVLASTLAFYLYTTVPASAFNGDHITADNGGAPQDAVSRSAKPSLRARTLPFYGPSGGAFERVDIPRPVVRASTRVVEVQKELVNPKSYNLYLDTLMESDNAREGTDGSLHDEIT